MNAETLHSCLPAKFRVITVCSFDLPDLLLYPPQSQLIMRSLLCLNCGVMANEAATESEALAAAHRQWALSHLGAASVAACASARASSTRFALR